MRKLIITALIFTVTFSVNAQNWWGKNKKVRGNGNVKTETRKTGDYKGVSVGGFFDVTLVKGKEGNIKIEGEENLMEYIITEVEKGTLKVKVKKGYNLRTTKKLHVTVPVEEIEKVGLGGSGNVTSEITLKSDDFSVSIGGSGNITLDVEANNIKSSLAGSGNINLSGSTDHFKCSIAGSGDIKAYDLQTNSLKASIAGSGDIRASVKNEIRASVAGSGNIYYKGKPDKKDIRSAGSGRIVSKN